MLTAMDRELAISIAATKVEGLTVDQLREAIDHYIKFASTCGACAGTGKIKARHDTDLKRSNDSPVLSGADVHCFVCDGTGKDSNEATWICRPAADTECDADEPHTGPDTNCGWSIMAPSGLGAG